MTRAKRLLGTVYLLVLLVGPGIVGLIIHAGTWPVILFFGFGALMAGGALAWRQRPDPPD